MDLCWMIANLDNRQVEDFGYSVDDPFCKYVGDRITGLLLRSQSSDQDSWAGHRIICIGPRIWDYYPPGMLSEEETQEIFADGERRDLFDFFSKNGQTPCSRLYVADEELYILRNLSKCEYVRSDVLAVRTVSWDEDQEIYDIPIPSLTAALISRISWSNGISSVFPDPKWPGIHSLSRGSWAGDRFDVVKSTEFKREGKEWTDVSENVAKELFAIWAEEYGDWYGDQWRDKSRQGVDIESPFPTIPLDVLRMIFEMTIEDDEAMALNLVRLSKTVNWWFTPLIYKTAIVPDYRIKNFQWTMENNGLKLGKFVRRLYLGFVDYRWVFQSCKEFASILSACTNLESFSTSFPLGTLVAMRDRFSFPSPKHIIFDYKTISVPHSGPHPLLRKVTHVCVSAMDLSSIRPAVAPELTHLAVHSQGLRYQPSLDQFAFINRVLRSFPSLKSFVILCYCSESHPVVSFEEEFWPAIMDIKDPRLVVRPGLDVQDYHAIMQGKAEDIWDDTKLCKDWRDRYVRSQQ